MTPWGITDPIFNRETINADCSLEELRCPFPQWADHQKSIRPSKTSRRYAWMNVSKTNSSQSLHGHPGLWILAIWIFTCAEQWKKRPCITEQRNLEELEKKRLLLIVLHFVFVRQLSQIVLETTNHDCRFCTTDCLSIKYLLIYDQEILEKRFNEVRSYLKLRIYMGKVKKKRIQKCTLTERLWSHVTYWDSSALIDFCYGDFQIF